MIAFKQNYIYIYNIYHNKISFMYVFTTNLFFSGEFLNKTTYFSTYDSEKLSEIIRSISIIEFPGDEFSSRHI